MTSRNLTRRLERLENNLVPAEEEPVVIVIRGVDAKGRVVNEFRLTPTGPQGLRTHDAHPEPEIHDAGLPA